MLKQEEYDIIQGGGDPKKLMLTNMKDEINDSVNKEINDIKDITEK